MQGLLLHSLSFNKIC